MGLIGRVSERLFGGADQSEAAAPPAPVSPIDAAHSLPVQAFGSSFSGLDDPYLMPFLRGAASTASGATVTVETAMRNTAVFRSVSLLASSIAMLPLHLYREGGAREKATSHPLFAVLYRKPNGWQTAYEFRSLMQAWVLLHGDAVAIKIKRGPQVIGLAPLTPARLTIRQDDDWSMRYEYQPPRGAKRVFGADDVFHLRGFSLDGIRGRALVRQAAEAIGLALQAERAAARLFARGMMAGGALSLPPNKKLSAEAYDRLKSSMEEHEGADAAGSWMITEEGMEAKPFTSTARDGQHIEQRRMQIEEIARIFGVPRPLLMVDDTSWGTGIDVLGQLFVRYGLNPWFTAWEQAIARDLLTPAEQGRYYARFNAGALLRGSMKDQAEFYARALGSGGHHPWMHQDEVRGLMELGERDDLPLASGATETGEQDDASRNA